MNMLNVTELYTLKWLIFSYMNFTLVKKKKKLSSLNTKFRKEAASEREAGFMIGEEQRGTELYVSWHSSSASVLLQVWSPDQ